MHETRSRPHTRAYLVGAELRGGGHLLSSSDSLRELALLADTAGLEVVGHTQQRLARIHPATFLGTGKIEEIGDSLQTLSADCVIFDDELSPRHQRELEKRFVPEILVLDRSVLIMDIFARHARTREGALQVELAQYEYRLPRLTRQWTHLARQAGGGGMRGVGTRGPGETQLEVDRREIQRRIAHLKREIEKVRGHRQRHRSQRSRGGIPIVSLIGYTNAGKSTLLNALSNADVFVADRLFATLDPTTRRIELPSGQEALLTDTVGFIQKLPTTLIAAFRATLEEVLEADLLLHLADLSHPNAAQHIETVEDTLAELEMPETPRLFIWNKADLWDERPLPPIPTNHLYLDHVMISAREREGLPSLMTAIERSLASQYYAMRLLLPYQQSDLLAHLYAKGRVQTQEDTAEGYLLRVQVPAQQFHQFARYQLSDSLLESP